MATLQLDAFQVIADPSRRHILHMLTKDRLSINAIFENFEMSRPAVSKHMHQGLSPSKIKAGNAIAALNKMGFAYVSESIYLYHQDN